MPEYAFLFEMGCGKTATLITTLRFKYNIERRIMRTLIISPAVSLENWKREIGVHAPAVVAEAVQVMGGSTKDKLWAMKQAGALILVTNLESFDNAEICAAIQKWAPEVVVVDEMQRIKNYKSKRTKFVWRLGDGARLRYGLSGSPLLNSPMDIFAQWRFLDRGATFGANFFSFRSQWFEDKNAGMPSQRYFPNWQPKPSVNDEFHRMIYRKASRVLKKDALTLPPLVRKEHVVGLGPEQRRMYESMKAHLIAYMGTKACVAKIALTKTLRLQQILCGYFVDDEGNVTTFKDCPRTLAIRDLIEQICTENGHKLIVWSCFAETYQLIRQAAWDAGQPNPVEIVGGMPPKQRQGAIDAFQNDPSVKVMIANQRAGGIAVNLTAASYMLYAAKGFSLEDDSQSEARAHRGGSEIHESITRIDLVAPKTLDETINQRLINKMVMAEDILSLRALL